MNKLFSSVPFSEQDQDILLGNLRSLHEYMERTGEKLGPQPWDEVQGMLDAYAD